jgi:hypothetical protein
MTSPVQQMLTDMLNSGKVPPQLLPQINAAMSDPAKLDEMIDHLKALGADQMGGGRTKDIGEYYQRGEGNYELRWPLSPTLPLPIEFDDLDRKTQFFVLFREWSRREMEGMMLLNRGDVDAAESIFQECLERAKQIEVNELVARSYEGFMRVARQRGDRNKEREWSQKAVAVRRE